jgi:hypothetical protein
MATLDILAYAQCIFDVADRNRQKVVDHDPFETGLFFNAWLTRESKNSAKLQT